MRWKRLLCWMFFHPTLIIVHQCSRYSMKLQCPRCQRYYGMNEDARVFIAWSPVLAVCGKHN